MARPKGTPKTGGRRAGTPNKATADVKVMARKHGPAVIAGFWRIFQNGDTDAAKIAAGKELLDRAYGKATQPFEGELHVFREYVGKPMTAEEWESSFAPDQPPAVN